MWSSTLGPLSFLSLTPAIFVNQEWLMQTTLSHPPWKAKKSRKRIKKVYKKMNENMALLFINSLLAMLFSLSLLTSSLPSENPSNLFIILAEPLSKPTPFQEHQHWYTSILATIKPTTSNQTKPFIHLYTTLLHGFSTTLTPHQARRIENIAGILAVFRDTILHLHTTRSPEFLGLNHPNARLWNISDYGSDVIIGILDTGIWPESRSFRDTYLSPVPSRWRGQCQQGPGFAATNCNRKLIGARFFSDGYETSVGSINSTSEFRSPRDSDGHGTHTASIAAGVSVTGAGIEGFASGVSSGMAPKARLATYKVCWFSGCLLSDICSAFDQAIQDGVDIISFSLGTSVLPFYLDLIAVATFRSSEKGVFVSASAGNEGPGYASVTNTPPWITTVGAGTIDRAFPAVVLLGNGKILHGVSLSIAPGLMGTPHALFFAGKVSYNSRYGSLHGKIVLCRAEKHVSRIFIGSRLKSAGAVGMIISHGETDPAGIIAEPHVIPAIAVGNPEAKMIEEYITSANGGAIATIFSKGTVLNVRPAPVVASFSSRGPNLAVPGILKPDLLAPGVNILGAWTGSVGPSGLETDGRVTEFNVDSGTSMACPHVSGVAALLKASHPEWSPAAIKSALMTTAATNSDHSNSSIFDEFSGRFSNAFGMGSGHLQPEKALHPGLVYDIGYQDYLRFICGLNYTEKQIRIIAGKVVSCSETVGWEFQLNYPSFVAVEDEFLRSIVFFRVLKNVGRAFSVYRARVVAPIGFKVSVRPEILRFTRIGQSLRFKLKVESMKRRRVKGNFSAGSLMWTDEGGDYVVRSPILVLAVPVQSST